MYDYNHLLNADVNIGYRKFNEFGWIWEDVEFLFVGAKLYKKVGIWSKNLYGFGY